MASNNNPEVLSPELKALRSEIKNWERQFAQANGRKPSKDDVKKDKNAVELYKRFNKMKTAASLASQSPPLSPPAAVNEAAAPANLLSSTEVAVPDVPIVAEARVKVAIAVAPPVQDQEQERVQPQGQVQEPEQEHQGVRPTTATGISRAEALRKSQALRKRHQVGRVTQSGLGTNQAPIDIASLNVNLAAAAASAAASGNGSSRAAAMPSVMLTSPISPVTALTVYDDGVMHPTTLHIPSAAAAAASSTAEGDPQGPQLQRDAFAVGGFDGNVPIVGHDGERPSTAGSSGSSGATTSDKDIKPAGEGDEQEPNSSAEDVDGGTTADVVANPDEAHVQVSPGLVLDVFKPPAAGEIVRGSVLRSKNPSRPDQTTFNLQDGTFAPIASARREASLKLKPTYYLFNRGSASDAPKEAAVWKIKGNYEGSTFRITNSRTGELYGLVHYTSSCVPRAMLVVSSTSTSGPISVAIETALTASNFAWPPKFTHPNLDTTGLLVYKNKLPKFNDNLKTFCLNFHGRVTMPSVKNFQLALASEVDDGSGAAGTGGSVRLQFGRVAKDSFTIDVSAPMSVMMGYAIALTTFDAIEKV